MNGEIRELFGKLIEKDAKNNTGSLETMKEIWPIVKGKEDPFSVAIRSVIVKGATDIKEVEPAAASEGVYYNLNGQRVNAPVKGIYIKDGKKVLVK